MTAPYLAAVVVVNVSAAHNGGSALAPAVITRVNPDGSVNVRVLHDAPQGRLARHQSDHLTDVVFHDTCDAAGANRRGEFGAFWPPGSRQALAAEVPEVPENQEESMTETPQPQPDPEPAPEPEAPVLVDASDDGEAD